MGARWAWCCWSRAAATAAGFTAPAAPIPTPAAAGSADLPRAEAGVGEGSEVTEEADMCWEAERLLARCLPAWESREEAAESRSEPPSATPRPRAPDPTAAPPRGPPELVKLPRCSDCSRRPDTTE